MWGIMIPTKYPHQQKYPWSSKKLDQGQFKTPMLASFRHSSSKLSGKNAMEGMGQFHWHLLPVAGAIWFYKNHAVVKEWCLIQCCSPYYFINRLYACQISSIYLRREEGANFSFTHQPAPFIIQQKHCLKGMDKNKNLKVAKLIESTWDEHHVDLDTSRTQC